VKQNLNLNWLRSFETTARHLSFTAASHELNLTQTAVSQHIKALETKLGQKLFIRRAKSLSLTDIGNAYLPAVREALERIEFSTNGLFRPDMSKTIIIRASMAFIIWLSPKLSAFQQQHPSIGIKLVTSLWQSDPEGHPVNIDIVLAPQKHTLGQLEKLSDEMIVPICGQETATKIKTIADLNTINPIHIQGFDDHWRRYLAAFDLPHKIKTAPLVVDTSVAACELAAAENGCAIMIERFAIQALQSGRPIKIIGPPVSLGQSHFISRKQVGPRDQHATDQFLNWLRRYFQQS
jgi:LysR family glycine cleavage system transcriptional activator